MNHWPQQENFFSIILNRVLLDDFKVRLHWDGKTRLIYVPIAKTDSCFSPEQGYWLFTDHGCCDGLASYGHPGCWSHEYHHSLLHKLGKSWGELTWQLNLTNTYRRITQHSANKFLVNQNNVFLIKHDFISYLKERVGQIERSMTDTHYRV